MANLQPFSSWQLHPFAQWHGVTADHSPKTAARRARLAPLVPPALPFASPQDVSRSREHRVAVCVRVATDVVGVRMARRAPLAVHSVRTHARMNPGSPVESRYAARLMIAV
jgi:hypothetical protein